MTNKQDPTQIPTPDDETQEDAVGELDMLLTESSSDSSDPSDIAGAIVTTDDDDSDVASSLDQEMRSTSKQKDSVFRAYPLLALRKVNVKDAHTGEHVWDDLSFECYEGQSYALLLDTTQHRQHNALVGLLSGFEQPTSGQVMLKATNMNTLSPLELRGRRMGLLLQDYALRDDLTAIDNLKYGMQASLRNYVKPLDVVAQELLTQVGFAHDGTTAQSQDERSRVLVGKLNPVEYCRVMIARALATDPEIIVADEPTALCNDEDEVSMLKLLRAQTQGSGKKRAVVVVTEREHVAAQMGY